MSKRQVLFVINPKAGDSDKSNLKHLINQACSQKKRAYSIYETTGVDDDNAISMILSEQPVDAVVACGGDGTVNMIAKILMNTQTSLGIIPLGSANGLAYDLEIPEDISDSLEIILTGRAIALDILEVNNANICLHLSDLGFNAKMIQEFENLEERGMMAYAKAFFSMLSDRETINFKITLDDKTVTKEAEMIVLANASSYGTGAVINPESSLQDGNFEVIVFKPIPALDLPELTFESFFGNIKNSPFVDIYRTKSAIIRTEQKQLLQVDGEVIGEFNQLRVSIHHRSIKVILPQDVAKTI
ncbi:diacylglycerol/lipid kinase family protein [Fulvivirga lutimaris]|uniref:diacylglycerol/lipid kinase family protein n=1 Tax=Fulvivirga lutimaris TaxID=1819566 RepID=UPI0012BC8487|nr:diacylglycerol kinase family protein [Fulvivirga lutimaris]MTI40083.1 diacylglycerol kinase family lipid kinase [Fulvivirga lutimaris]